MALGWFCRAIEVTKPAQLVSLLGFSLCILGSYAIAAAEQSSLTVLDTRINTQAIATATPSPTITTENLILKAYFAESLEVPDQAIHWQVSDMQGVPVQQVQGQGQSLKLAEGNYQITLSIGHFKETKQLTIQPQVISQPYFKAELGRLAIVANHAADWTVRSLSHTETSFDLKATQQIDAWLPAGFYEVTPMHSGVARRQVVNVLTGDISALTIDIPVVQVNLIAVENNQPFFKPVEWSVFRLEKGERQHVGNYYQHSQGITVPTGYYEVVATHDATVRSRQFWVKENTTNKIVLAMD